ncbi:hypothetical protein [Orenia marismortui]|uniref:hypothetical protein n=1 Tax=Orenia marismortui TaxID=46469 RepID=UPI000370A109|nr:hypothetical protein [Orenia marismortui]
MATVEEIIQDKQPAVYKELCILKMSLTLRGKFKEVGKCINEVVKQAAKAFKEISKKLSPVFEQMARVETKRAMKAGKEEARK